MERFTDFGILLLRVGLGIMMAWHGFPKFTGGVAAWTEIGGAMSFVGVTIYPVFWGFCAAVIEFFGGIALVFGLFTRLVSLLLCLTMAVAATMHLSIGDGLQGASHAIELTIVFLAVIFIGPGRFSVDRRLT
ncbi:MAG: DoxX family protein [Verrucomicrobia bacterium]|nr:MAG: DoxX family protein [Verrucomicrobiota bacterium]